jgi:membrane protease YdiL (CAAX protease family)
MLAFSEATALKVVWGIIGLLSCYGIAWFFRHARRWAEEGASETETLGESVSESSPELPQESHSELVDPIDDVFPSVQGSESRPGIDGQAVLVFFAVWICVQFGFLGLVYEQVKLPEVVLELGGPFELSLPAELSSNVFLMIFINLIGQLMVLFLVLPFVATLRGLPKNLGLDRVPTLRHCIALAGLWLFFLVPIFTVEKLWVQFLQWTGHRPFLQTTLKAYGGAVENGNFLMIVAVATSAVALAPVLEELLYRGMLHNFLSRQNGIVVGTLCSAAFFSIMHVVPAVLVPIFVLGCLLSAIFEWRRSVWDCIVFHAYFNAGSLAITSLYVFWMGQPV